MQIHPHANSEMISDFTFYCPVYDGVELEACGVMTGLNLNRGLHSFSTVNKTNIDHIGGANSSAAPIQTIDESQSVKQG